MGLFKTGGGGGFLNDVAGVISGYKFDSKTWEPKKKGGDPYTTLSVELLITPDGADAPVQQFIPAGFLHDGETISDDGLSLESDSDSPIIGADTDFAKFITSLIEHRPDFEGEFDENGRNFAAMLNWRVQFVKIVDKEATEKFGKRVAKSGAHKGKEFNRDYLAVSKVYEQVTGKKSSGGSKAAAATASKSAPAKAKKGNDIEDVAKGVLLGILADAKNNTVAKGTLSSAIVKYCLANDLNDQREDIRKALTDEFIAGLDGVDVDAKAKTISLA